MGLLAVGARHAWDGNGDPVSGGRKYVYRAGTTDPVTTYSDAALTNPQTVPILADAEGIFPQSYVPDGAYKVVIKDASDVTLWEYDNLIVFDESSLAVYDTDQTLRIPTDYPNRQEAFFDAQGWRVKDGAELIALIEQGYEINTALDLRDDGFERFRLASEDATVNVSTTYPDESALAEFTTGDSPRWDIEADMRGYGNNGVFVAQGANLTPLAGSGVINTGANGDNPNGANFLVFGNLATIYDSSTNTGLSASGAAKRGIWTTFTGRSTGKWDDVSNSGSDPAYSEGHAAFFLSRGASQHHDNADATGSARGIRAARALGSYRDSDFSNIDGNGAWGFEIGLVTASRCDWSNSGWTGDWSTYGSVYSDRIDVNADESAVTDIYVKADGFEVYICGANGDDVTQYTLTDAFDLGTVSGTQTFSVAGQDTTPTGLFFKTDGFEMYVVGVSSGQVHQYTLGTAWDISTAAFNQSFTVSGQDTSPQSVAFSDDGATMFILGLAGTSVYEYTLSTAWDISTASYVTSFSVATQDDDPRGIAFSAAGAKMTVAGRQNNRLYEYELSTPFDITTATYARFDSLVSDGNPSGIDADSVTGIHFPSFSRYFVTGTLSNSDTIFKFVTADYPVLYLGGPLPDQPQGGGWINAERGVFDGAKATLAEADTSTAFINMDDAVSATDLLAPVATITNGLVHATRSRFLSSTSSIAPHMVLVSDRGEFEGTACTMDGAGVVPYIVRVTEGGIAHMRGASMANAATSIFDMRDGGGNIFLRDNEIDGVAGKFPNGVTLGDTANFATRAEAVDAISYGFDGADGKTFKAAGLWYEFLRGATSIPSMPNVVPVAPAYPDHYGDNGTPGSTDVTDAVVAWAADENVLEKAAKPNTEYLCSSLVSSGSALDFAEGAVINGNGATIKFTETDTSDNQRGTLGDGAQMYDLRFLWGDNGGVGHYFERFLACKGNNVTRGLTFEAETEQPDTTDSSGFDTTLRIDENNVTIHDTTFINIWDCCRAWAGGTPQTFRAYNTEIRGYSSGITCDDFVEDVVIDGLTVGARNTGTTESPGENAITGGCTKMTVRDVVIDDSGEHAIYLATGGTLASPVYNLTMENIRVRSSAQCAIKLRGWSDFVVRDVWGANAHNSSAPGDNEDGIRFEQCTNGQIFSSGHGNEDGSGSGGNDLIHIDSCTDLDFSGMAMNSAQRAAVYITDTDVADSIENLRFNGITFSNCGNDPIFQIVVGDLPDKAIQVEGLLCTDATGNLVNINATGTVGSNPVVITGRFETSGSLITNTAGGSGVIMDLEDAYYIGGALPTVATLANIPSVTGFRKAVVTDANATTFASVVAGGGANTVPVYYDGTNWLIG